MSPRQSITAVCPHCGQRLLMRHGVRLPPRLADMFDMIVRVGKRGITIESMAWVFYGDKPTRDAKNCVKANICRLNDLLESTDVQVRLPGRGEGYRVVKRRVRLAA